MLIVYVNFHEGYNYFISASPHYLGFEQITSCRYYFHRKTLIIIIIRQAHWYIDMRRRTFEYMLLFRHVRAPASRKYPQYRLLIAPRAIFSPPGS